MTPPTIAAPARLLLALLVVAALAPAVAARGAAPLLVSTEPANGATGVDPRTTAVSLVFDQPMQAQGSLGVAGPWSPGELFFFGDRIFFFYRTDLATLLPGGTTITFTVNPPGSLKPFVNLAGQPAATATFSFTVAPGTAAPAVVSTLPSRGAIDVDPALDAIAVTFGEPLDPSYVSYTLPASWGPSSYTWSGDLRTLTIHRDQAGDLLPARDLVTLVLNPAGSTGYLRDFDGNALPTTEVAFGIEPYEHFPAVVATDPPNGAVGVAPNRTTFSVTFGEPMADAVGFSASPVWGASTWSWSADRRTLFVTRTNAASPLPAEARIEVALDITPGSVDWLHPPAFLRNPRGDRLPAYSFAFQVAPRDGAPQVVGTDPANGDVRDDPHLAEIVIAFDRPMLPAGCTNFSTTGDEWNDPDLPLLDHWSADGRSYHIVRNNPDTVLRSGKEITVTLNPQPCGDYGYRAAGPGGALLGAYSFTFTIGDGDATLYAVPADPARGFEWPYYLGLPPALDPEASLLVEPNNTGASSDEVAVHDRAAEALALVRANHMTEIGVPWLVPVFPRPDDPPLYTHSLDRDTLLATAPGLQRLDLQLIAMIADARLRLAERGIQVAPRVLVHGFSASGAFAHRFAILHPELVQAVASGSGAGWPIAPVPEWDGVPLRYPVGIADLASLVGGAFSATAFRRVPLFLYVGDTDENDPVPGWDPVDRDAVFALTGVESGPIWPRWLVADEIHRGAGMDAARVVIYAGAGHTITSDMWNDLQPFFVDALPEPGAGFAALAAAAALGGLAARRGRHRR